jgi:molecular chaperone DnaK
MGATVGIDLGTTNSCVAVVDDGRPKVVEDERGYNILPSCIAMKGRGRFVVGHGAKALVLTHPKDALYAVKRFIGHRFDDPGVQEAMKHMAFDIVEGERGSILLRMGDLEVTPVEASSIILKAVKDIAERAIGEEVTDAIITVPAHFTHLQRKATIEAGEKAGLTVQRLINEPTAAALAYGFRKDVDKKIAIYDLGGGTFDVSVLEVGDGVYEILGTEGNNYLGGEDFDYRIIDWLADQFHAQTGVDPREDRVGLQRLRDAAERAKCELSFVDRTPVLVPHLSGEHNLETELTREQLEDMVQDLINETIKITDSALRSAGVSVEELDEIILVGGMTRMPKIQEIIKVFFGMNPCRGVHPEEVVAVGAAVHGYSLASETSTDLLLDVTPYALGMDVAGGFFKQIIEKNATVPCSETRAFTTVKDGQTEVKIKVRQGESKLASENEFLGEFTLTGIREAEKMTPRIDVTFKIDSSGILHVSAVDRDTGESQAIVLQDYLTTAATEEDGPGSKTDGSDGAGKKRKGPGVLGRLFGRGKKKKEEKATEAVAGAAAMDDAGSEDSEIGAGDSVADMPDQDGELSDLGDDALSDISADTGAMAGDSDLFRLPDTDSSAPRDALAERAEGASGRQPDRHAIAERIGKSSAASDPFAISERDAGPVEDSLAPVPVDEIDPFAAAELSAAGNSTPEVDTSEFDAYGIAPRKEGGGADFSKARKSITGQSNDPEFDPYGLVERGGAKPSSPSAASTAPAKKRRKPARLRISYKNAATFVKEYERNVGRGGTFIKTKKPLAVGRDCVLFLTVPGIDEPLELKGVVVWSSREKAPEPGKEEGMGIKFDTSAGSGLDRVTESLALLVG